MSTLVSTLTVSGAARKLREIVSETPASKNSGLILYMDDEGNVAFTKRLPDSMYPPDYKGCEFLIKDAGFDLTSWVSFGSRYSDVVENDRFTDEALEKIEAYFLYVLKAFVSSGFAFSKEIAGELSPALQKAGYSEFSAVNARGLDIVFFAKCIFEKKSVEGRWTSAYLLHDGKFLSLSGDATSELDGFDTKSIYESVSAFLEGLPPDLVVTAKICLESIGVNVKVRL